MLSESSNFAAMRRLTLASPVRGTVVWMTATMAIVGLLTAMLIATIAITV